MSKQIKKKPLSNKEYLQLLGNHPLTDLCLFTGARIAEVNRIINEWEEGKTYVDIKTKKSQRLNRIELTEKAIKAIETCRKIGIYNVTDRTLSRIIKEVSDRVRIDFTAHNLRATFATRLHSFGVDIKTISVLLNHSDISQTAQYIAFDEFTKRVALSVMEDGETFEGMTLFEAKKEILKLRKLILRKDLSGNKFI